MGYDVIIIKTCGPLCPVYAPRRKSDRRSKHLHGSLDELAKHVPCSLSDYIEAYNFMMLQYGNDDNGHCLVSPSVCMKIIENN